jgi:hypothetical protein
MTLFFKTVLLLAAALTFVAARPSPNAVSHRHREIAIAKRGDCNDWPSGPNIELRNLIVQICDEMGVDYTVCLSIYLLHEKKSPWLTSCV